MENIFSRLRSLTQVDLQSQWRQNTKAFTIPPQDFQNWNPAIPNPKGYLTWESGRQVYWLGQKIILPGEINNYPVAGFSLRLELTWWAELAEIYINGEKLREGDLFDCCCRLLLRERVTPGETIAIAIKLVSPQHDVGALMQSRCIYEGDQDPGFIADQLNILANYLTALAPQDLPQLQDCLNSIDWSLLTSPSLFDQQLVNICTDLLPLTSRLQDYHISLLGHAHLDLAWLWTICETWQVAQNTFTSVLSLQQSFPELTFGHTTAVLYQWIEEHNPQLFQQIQAAVTQGKWEILGGMWVEPDVNLVGGESLIRQIFYGQSYFQAKFGHICQVAWLPDSFGFPWQLPQILRQGGMDYFVTGKLHWNDTNSFPYGWFEWRSPDGTSILTLLSPPNLTGVMDTNPLSMTSYLFAWQQQNNLSQALWLPGVGDHGGGPTQEMLEVYQRWSDSPFLPPTQFTSALSYLQRLPSHNLPVWDDELYLELHRGCYTTHAEQKYWNRYAEGLLYEAELFLAWAYLISQRIFMRAPIPMVNNITEKQFNCQVEKINRAWQQILCNQFHDILPGTSIPEVFTETQTRWDEAICLGEGVREMAVRAIACQINIPSPPTPESQAVIIFNSLNWSRTEIITLTTPPGEWEVRDLNGKAVPSQTAVSGELLFHAENLPSLGYRLYWLSPLPQPLETPRQSDSVLDNGLVRVTICPITGDISSIYDYQNQREILRHQGNQLQSFRDQGQYWDAWNIDPDYQKHPLPTTQLHSLECQETGPIRWKIRVVKSLGQSQWQQDYILSHNSPILRIVNRVDWQETHTLVKAAFPFALNCDKVVYGTACGAIARPTSPVTPEAAAKWEVPGLGWAAFDDPQQKYGVSILSDYKYGYDSQPQQLRLTLLRSPTWPDPQADKGLHHFTYAIYPYAGTWQKARTVHRALELSLPPQVVPISQKTPQKAAILPPENSFLQLGSDNLLLLAFKPSNQGDWILRCYEAYGQEATMELSTTCDLAIVSEVDILERDLPGIPHFTLPPWRIASFRLQ